MNYYAPKKKVPILPLLIVPIILIISFSYVNFSPYISNCYSILDMLVSSSYLLLWGLMYYFAWKSNSVFISSIYCGVWILCFVIILVTFLTDPSIKNSTATGFFSTDESSFIDPQYHDFYDVDFNKINITSILAILPLCGFRYAVNQFGNSATIVSSYITLLSIALVFIAIATILIFHSIKMRFVEKKIENTLKMEEENHRYRHRFD
ncbi:hypothetical protein RBG61_02215 [Paludicola sp. MB14-C6]|uniref:hypothetical protein n=1 Tax=Paludihabitans sp. MB14-C6 TaxID=3070656 RepID=UPI0027DCE7B8|nr:hypothetical protein [Paludicola sp. MB14-C6]WMJ23507.1 hypothetical protein RBG61_02215 [Paludicola sp. MB14-C6]